MKHTRVVVSQYGAPDALRVVQEQCSEPQAGEVRVRVLAAGVSLPDVMAREGTHPETPRVPFTPGWDLVGVVDRLGADVSGIEPGQTVTALPIHGAYAEYVCLPQSELVPVPPGLDPAEAVSLVLNYVTAYQMMHRSVHVEPGQRVLIHGAAGGVGSALVQLGVISKLQLFGTCSARKTQALSEMGCTPINYQQQDFVREIRRITGDGVDVVFDPVGGAHLWESRKALRRGGTVVGYGLRTSLRGEALTSTRPGRRQRFRGVPRFAMYIAGGWLLPGRRRVIPYSIQTLKRLRPAWFREDLTILLDLLREHKVQPVVAQRLPFAEAKQAHEMLGKGGVIGKIVLVPAASQIGTAANVSDSVVATPSMFS